MEEKQLAGVFWLTPYPTPQQQQESLMRGNRQGVWEGWVQVIRCSSPSGSSSRWHTIGCSSNDSKGGSREEGEGAWGYAEGQLQALRCSRPSSSSRPRHGWKV